MILGIPPRCFLPRWLYQC